MRQRRERKRAEAELIDRRRKTAMVSDEWKVQPELPRLLTDPVKLKLVLKNLINNAMKFTERGGVTVSVQTRDGGVAFDVSDTGIGISPAVLPNIFDLFRQAEPSDTRRYGGVGLGLYIVRRLLDLLGGTITVDTIVGRGSTFGVWLPANVSPASGRQT